MKRRNFTSSNSLIRGLMLANKAGIFHFRSEGEFTPIIRRPAYTKRLRNASARESELFDGGIWRAAFVFPPLMSNSSLMEIQTPQGKVIIIDDEDFEIIKRHKWNAVVSHKKWYAYTVKTPQISMHRLIMKAKPGQIVDHINGNGLDNRKENLRFCTIAENNRNRGLVRTNTTGFQGVHFDKVRGKFVASIRQNNKTKYLGTFDCPFKAARAYDAAAKELHGEFANLNFKQESK